MAAKNQLFQKANGARPGVSKVCNIKRTQNNIWGYMYVYTWCPSTVSEYETRGELMWTYLFFPSTHTRNQTRLPGCKIATLRLGTKCTWVLCSTKRSLNATWTRPCAREYFQYNSLASICKVNFQLLIFFPTLDSCRVNGWSQHRRRKVASRSSRESKTK